MKLLKKIIGLWRRNVNLQVIEPGKCAVCGEGPNPATGVPIPCVTGAHMHLLCILQLTALAPGEARRVLAAQWN